MMPDQPKPPAYEPQTTPEQRVNLYLDIEQGQDLAQALDTLVAVLEDLEAAEAVIYAS